MRSMYDHIMGRIEQLALSDVKDKEVRLHGKKFT